MPTNSTHPPEHHHMQQRRINPWTWQDQFAISQALEVTAGQQVLYCSGQASVDADGRPVHPEDMRGQIEQALDNLETVLGTAGYRLADVVRLNMYVTDVDQFLEAYGTFAKRLVDARCRPSSTLLGVTRLAYPELLLELEATAVR
jgi:2-iminobutanoate/2-iminopropanoate deaminase